MQSKLIQHWKLNQCNSSDQQTKKEKYDGTNKCKK